MSATWYECKVKYRKTLDSGEQKPTTETYLLDAVSYTEAEARISEEMKTLTSEEFMITNIKVANLAEVHPFENSDRWFKCKVTLIAFDDESGKEKKSNMYMLIQANDVKEAFDNTNQAMQNTMGEFSIPAITESPILDVFPYFDGEEELNDIRVEDAETVSSEEINEELVEEEQIAE
ncbi:DUF4494 domain-containing protein [Gramella sp. GC03-9]|uniref:DUF4494 domain-containing protein n=1 Tax=Christiangramia oceanisediminis TaxID=2920386 RepID=A0A9X2I5V4_9FLAO|nr:DUF4494 domain-containing protein [Gramella oceanisediminis]MCP9199967.1 DUF4494 domain-containing protein [Gramella oceanisediminis]